MSSIFIVFLFLIVQSNSLFAQSWHIDSSVNRTQHYISMQDPTTNISYRVSTIGIAVDFNLRKIVPFKVASIPSKTPDTLRRQLLQYGSGWLLQRDRYLFRKEILDERLAILLKRGVWQTGYFEKFGSSNTIRINRKYESTVLHKLGILPHSTNIKQHHVNYDSHHSKNWDNEQCFIDKVIHKYNSPQAIRVLNKTFIGKSRLKLFNYFITTIIADTIKIDNLKSECSKLDTKKKLQSQTLDSLKHILSGKNISYNPLSSENLKIENEPTIEEFENFTFDKNNFEKVKNRRQHNNMLSYFVKHLKHDLIVIDSLRKIRYDLTVYTADVKTDIDYLKSLNQTANTPGDIFKRIKDHVDRMPGNEIALIVGICCVILAFFGIRNATPKKIALVTVLIVVVVVGLKYLFVGLSF